MKKVQHVFFKSDLRRHGYFTVKMKSVKKGVSSSNRVKVWQLMNICFKKLRDFTDPPGSRHKMNTIQCSVEIRQNS